MSFITKKHLSRRTFLRGTGVSLALPLLDSMVPAGTLLAQTAATPKTRLGCIYIPHGATMDKWTPAGEGTAFQFSEILQPLEAFRDRLVVVSDLAHAPVAPATGEDTGGAENHVRAAAVFLSGAHPVKKNEAFVGATVDQIAAQHVGQDTPLPSIELSMEPVNLTCGDAGFTCAYRNTLSWKNATLPLPMENNPQIVFQRLFGDGSTDAQRQERRNQAKSLLDSIRGQVPSLEKDLPAGDRWPGDLSPASAPDRGANPAGCALGCAAPGAARRCCRRRTAARRRSAGCSPSAAVTSPTSKTGCCDTRR